MMPFLFYWSLGFDDAKEFYEQMEEVLKNNPRMVNPILEMQTKNEGLSRYFHRRRVDFRHAGMDNVNSPSISSWNSTSNKIKVELAVSSLKTYGL